MKTLLFKKLLASAYGCDMCNDCYHELERILETFEKDVDERVVKILEKKEVLK